MLAEAATGLEIIVWRPFEPPHQILFAASPEATLQYVSEGAHRDIFRWQTREDVWGGIKDPDLRQRLREKLVNGFDPFAPSVDRSISKLGEFLGELKAAISAGSTTWSVSTQIHGEDEEAAVVNSVMGLYRQLCWIYRVFQDVPGAFLAVR